MIGLIEGEMYRCSDGDFRRLTKIEEGFLHYDVAIGRKKDGTLIWTSAGRTYRWQVERKFTEGEFIDSKGVKR